MAVGKRRKAREAAFQALYQLDLKSWEESASSEELLASVHRGEPLPPQVAAYALRLLENVRTRRNEIDEVLSRASQNWEVGRMATVERNVLRLAVCEILFEPEVPAAVIIDEALALAKRFGDRESGAFVNGLLDVIAREQRAPQEGRQP